MEPQTADVDAVAQSNEVREQSEDSLLSEYVQNLLDIVFVREQLGQHCSETLTMERLNQITLNQQKQMLSDLQSGNSPSEESKQPSDSEQDEAGKKIEAHLAEVEASVDQLETGLGTVEQMIRDLELKLQK